MVFKQPCVFFPPASATTFSGFYCVSEVKVHFYLRKSGSLLRWCVVKLWRRDNFRDDFFFDLWNDVASRNCSKCKVKVKNVPSRE